MYIIDMINSDLEKVEIYNNHNKLIKTGLIIYYFIFNGGIRALILYRLYRHLFLKKNKLFYLVYALSSLITPIELAAWVDMGKGITIPHPKCIIVGYGKIGDNVTISQGVTIGLKRKLDEFPEIGDNVHIGAGAKVLGKVKIGSNSRIGANAVVINLNVPENSIAVGIPAIVKKFN